MYFVYILYSPSRDRYYVGSTHDLERRLTEHNHRNTKSTRSGIPWEMVYSKEVEDHTAALKLERKIKSMKSRKYIEELIASG